MEIYQKPPFKALGSPLLQGAELCALDDFDAGAKYGLVKSISLCSGA